MRICHSSLSYSVLKMYGKKRRKQCTQGMRILHFRDLLTERRWENVTHILLPDLSANKPLHFNLKASHYTHVDVLLSTLYWIVFHALLIYYMSLPPWAPCPALHRSPCVHPGDWDSSISSGPVMNHTAETLISLFVASPSLISVWAVGEEVPYSLWSNLHTWLQELFCMSGFMNNDLMSLGFYHFTLSNAFPLTLFISFAC